MTDQAHEPLIESGGEEQEDLDEQYPNHDMHDELRLLEDDLRHPGLLVWLLTFSAGISGLLFGCKSSIAELANMTLQF
jgi:SP family myo-inositol transporter-like MFS transporter 13